MKVNGFFLSLFAILFILSSCKPSQEKKVNWSLFSKTELNKINKASITYGRKLQAHNLYVPLFNVDYHKNFRRSIPLSSHVIDLQRDSVFNIVPVIWFSNRIFLKSDSTQLEKLSEKIAERIVQLTDSAPIGELVMDCDWMPETKDAYFGLIKGIRSQLPYGIKKMTATLPLHYLRYGDTVGVPPVDKVILKLVSETGLGDLNEEADPLEKELIRPFLMDLQTYGTELEVGIPLGNWGILIRKNKPLRMFFSINKDELKRQGEFSQVDKNLIKVSEDAYFQGEYLSRGDFIRIENYRKNSIKALFPLIKEFTSMDSMGICLWDLNSELEEEYPTDLLKSWFAAKK
ncbi:MAG: hypothetical protein MRZ79_12020 [Bacteroidia bacterium]|nr:hypothetical protein [Bacteroidia bacterium]